MEAISRKLGRASMDAWPHDLRGALAAAGIRGPNLEKLAILPGLTVELIKAEYQAIQGDPKVRSRSAVLATALAKRFGVAVKRADRLSAVDQNAIADLEKLRRLRGGR